MPPKSVIRRGSPFTPSDTESLILRGMKSRYSLHRNEIKFYAGDAAYCPRRAVKFLVTDRMGEGTPSSAMYMKMGNAIHSVITDALHTAGVLVFKEFRLPPSENPDIRGLIDAIIFAAPAGVIGLEIKSCGSIPSKPKDDHLAQATTYSALSGLDIQIVYVSRKVAGYDGKLMIKSFDLDLTPSDMMRTLSKICLAHYAHAEGLLPPIPLGFQKERDCMFCSFTDECFDGAAEPLLTAWGEKLETLTDKADARALEILDDRLNRRNGILKHITRYATEDVAKRLEAIEWGPK